MLSSFRAKSDSVNDRRKFKFVVIPECVLAVKSPVTETQCFGLNTSSVSIRLQVVCNLCDGMYYYVIVFPEMIFN